MNDVHYSELERDIAFVPSELPLPPLEQIMTVCCGHSFTIGITHTLPDDKRSEEGKEVSSDGKCHACQDGLGNNTLLGGMKEKDSSQNTITTQSTRKPPRVFTFNTGSIEFST